MAKIATLLLYHRMGIRGKRLLSAQIYAIMREGAGMRRDVRWVNCSSDTGRMSP